MGIRDRLFGGRFHQPPPDQAPLSDAAIMNTGGDEYVGCIVQADEVESMIEVALRAGIQARLEAF